MELYKNTNFDFLGKQKLFIGLSLVLTVVGLASWVAKGGLKYGIDFTGGANVTVGFASKPPVDKIRASIGARIPGEISVQEVPAENSVIIGTGIKTDAELQAARGTIVRTLEEEYGVPAGKLDFNNASAQAIADRLRGPLQNAGAGLSDQQLLDAARAMTSFRDKNRSGLVRGIDELASVPGVTPAILTALKQEAAAGQFSIRGAEIIGPKIGAELRTKAVLATLYALAGMLVYLAFRFEFSYGLAAVIAVFHDVVITLGLFSLFDKEISINVIAALLTLVGYSMNDTIVVFDRIREDLKLTKKDSFPVVVNRAINQTLSRTILTSGLTFIAALSLFIFGGAVLHGFSFALVVGIFVGTYSSIFVASPILVWWQGLMEQRRKSGTAGASAK
jgi:preprotein translocase subunit SecF